jgi:ABC transporter with metal-binding/Fe-S-binding domain ATP-binding protein
MKVSVLFSGGKDSTYSIFLAKNQGHDIQCLLSIFPESDESHLLHYPNLSWTSLQSQSMQIPQLKIYSESSDTSSDLIALEKILTLAKKNYNIEGLVHGGINSNFQKEKFENICKKLKLISIAPLWNLDPLDYMNKLILSNFKFIVTSVSSDGLNDSWLGKQITRSDVDILHKLSKKFGFNLNFEGGEAETFVLDCPLFLTPIKIKQERKIWDGYRGRFEIVEAVLDDNAG